MSSASLFAQRMNDEVTFYRYDLDGDRFVDHADQRVLINELFDTTFGDSNLDGLFDSSDLVMVFRSGLYRGGIEVKANWESGDWNGDLSHIYDEMSF